LTGDINRNMRVWRGEFYTQGQESLIFMARRYKQEHESMIYRVRRA
jgi:hypothetical protein